MVGLAWKDAVVVLRDQWKIYLLFLAGMLVLPFWDSALGALPGLLAMVMVFIPTSACANDALARWDHFAPCTPMGREGVVAGKYLFAVWLALLGSAATCGLIYLLMDLLLIPLSFHFGAEKDNLGISALGLPALFLASGTASAALGQPNPYSVPFLLALVLTVVLLPVSFRVSTAIYRRKEL